MTQNRLEAWLADAGIVALSPSGAPNYDIAWSAGDISYVGEVKSLTKAESQQIRLGRGQVLDYSFILSIREGKQVVPVLVLERAPADGRWSDLCRRHGVLLVWPDTFRELGSATPGADNRGLASL